MTEKQLNEAISYWQAFYARKGVPHYFAEICLAYAGVLLRQDLPVIFDHHHLCLLLGLDEDYINSVVYGAKNHYRDFRIKKKSGGYRELSSPHYALKYVQKWIYTNILAKVKVNYCAHGFRPKKSILTNAKVHVKSTCLLKLDLKDFFPSITIEQVITVFNKLGYSKKVSFYLASICCVDGCLPQGAPTSPALSNIITCHLDNRMLGICKKMGLRYTRYADDMAFSGEHIKPDFVDSCQKIITECGFTLNESKVKLYKGDGAKLLTGLSLANKVVRLPREYRRTVEADLYYIKKHGLAEHMKRNKIKNPYYLESMIGKVEYWLMVEPDNPFALSSMEYLRLLYKQKKSFM